ncbi:MAG: hypothetical protein KBD37_07615 [Burkholderiales bacterium]|nr:hypothetical protein [Burkholderiales bacterium]
MRYCFIIAFISFLFVNINGCTRHDDPFSCNNRAVIDYLITAHSESGPVYYSKSLTGIKLIHKEAQSMSCSAIFSIKSNLDNHRVLSVPVTYMVYKVNNNHESNTSGLKIGAANLVLVDKWITSLNNFSTQLGDYQLTVNGAIYVLKESDQQTLYFNGEPITPEISNTQIHIEKSYVLESQPVLLIGSYTGGSIDADTHNNILVRLAPNNNYQVTQPFAYQSIIQNGESLIINGIAPGRPYAEIGDNPVYIYSGGRLLIKQDVKPESYYLTKFAHLTPKQIVDEAKQEQCFDNENNLLDISHTCRYASKYCFKFRALKESGEDQYYNILKQSCK